ncbi:MAG: hypothetical protein JJU11_06250 [Candidatus Sumerlaeia bacterium]|nr:hypothetical protein [Candidatus Sumerlaeia bacterium]
MNRFTIVVVAGMSAFTGSLAFAQPYTPPALRSILENASVGEQIPVGEGFPGILTIPAFNAFPNRFTDVPGTNIYSDDPETVEQFGRLYEANVPAGVVTVYTYHVNGVGGAGKFSVVLENPSETATATVTFGRRGLAGASGNYMLVGRLATQRFFTEPSPYRSTITIPPGGMALMDPEMETRTATLNELVNGWHEFETNQPLRVTSVFVASTANTLTTFPTLGFSPRDGFNRHGTYPAIARRNATAYSYNTGDGMRRVRIGNNPEDPPLAGVDDMTGQNRTLLGNYGIVYEIEYTIRNTSGERLALIMNPRGGAYGGWFRVTYGDQTNEGFVPSNAMAIAPAIENAGVVALLDPTPAPRTLRIVTSPAGAMSLPIELILAPYGESEWVNSDLFLFY